MRQRGGGAIKPCDLFNFIFNDDHCTLPQSFHRWVASVQVHHNHGQTSSS